MLLYIVSFISISFDLQIYFILQSKRESRKATNASKITINKKEVEDRARKIKAEARETKIETRIIETNIEAGAKATIIIATIAIATIDRKQLSKLRKQFVYIYVSLVLETTLMLLDCLLLFDNLQKYIDNTLYS